MIAKLDRVDSHEVNLALIPGHSRLHEIDVRERLCVYVLVVHVDLAENRYREILGLLLK